MSTLWLDDAEIVQTDPRPHRLALGRYDFDDEGALVAVDRVEPDLVGERTPVQVADAPLVLLNDGDLTYAKVRLDERSLATVEASLSRVADPLARGLIWSSLWNACRDGELSAARYLAVVRAHARVEPNSALQQSASANAAFTVANYVSDGQRSAARREWLDAALSALWAADAASGAQLTWARAVATAAAFDDARAAEIRAVLDGAAPAGLRLDPDLRWLLWTAVSATGHASVAELEAELALDATASGKTAWLRAMAARPLAEVKAAAWTSVFEDESLTNDHLDATIAGFRAGERRDLIGGYDEAYFAALAGVWAQRSIEIARRIVVGLFP